MEKAPTVALKFPLLCPAFTVTLDGTVTFALLLLITIEAADIAAPVNETVQVAELLGPTLAGEQDRELIWAAATRFRVALNEIPLALAAIVAV